jgi:hypothetical protein
MAGDGAALRGQAVGGGQIQFLWCPQDRDRGTRTCRRLGCALSHDHAPVAIGFWSPLSGSMHAGSHGTALSPQPGTTVPPARLHTGRRTSAARRRRRTGTPLARRARTRADADPGADTSSDNPMQEIVGPRHAGTLSASTHIRSGLRSTHCRASAARRRWCCGTPGPLRGPPQAICASEGSHRARSGGPMSQGAGPSQKVTLSLYGHAAGTPNRSGESRVCGAVLPHAYVPVLARIATGLTSAAASSSCLWLP